MIPTQIYLIYPLRWYYYLRVKPPTHKVEAIVTDLDTFNLLSNETDPLRAVLPTTNEESSVIFNNIKCWIHRARFSR